MSTALANPQVVINNDPIAVVPNSVAFTEGAGEQNMRAASTGGQSTEPVFSDNVETNFSMFKMQIFPTPKNIELVREWKKNRNVNVISLTGVVQDGATTSTLRRSFTQAAILNDYEVALGADTVIEVEFKSQPAV